MRGAKQRAMDGYYGCYVLTSARYQDQQFQELINDDQITGPFADQTLISNPNNWQ